MGLANPTEMLSSVVSERRLASVRLQRLYVDVEVLCFSLTLLNVVEFRIHEQS